MPTQKLGQIASNQINDLSQKHFDVDMKIRDILQVVTLDAKTILASRLDSIVNGIEAEIKANLPPQ